jgi:hypothetical protein
MFRQYFPCGRQTNLPWRHAGVADSLESFSESLAGMTSDLVGLAVAGAFTAGGGASARGTPAPRSRRDTPEPPSRAGSPPLVSADASPGAAPPVLTLPAKARGASLDAGAAAATPTPAIGATAGDITSCGCDDVSQPAPSAEPERVHRAAPTAVQAHLVASFDDVPLPVRAHATSVPEAMPAEQPSHAQATAVEVPDAAMLEAPAADVLQAGVRGASATEPLGSSDDAAAAAAPSSPKAATATAAELPGSGPSAMDVDGAAVMAADAPAPSPSVFPAAGQDQAAAAACHVLGGSQPRIATPDSPGAPAPGKVDSPVSKPRRRVSACGAGASMAAASFRVTDSCAAQVCALCCAQRLAVMQSIALRCPIAERLLYQHHAKRLV